MSQLKGPLWGDRGRNRWWQWLWHLGLWGHMQNLVHRHLPRG